MRDVATGRTLCGEKFAHARARLMRFGRKIGSVELEGLHGSSSGCERECTAFSLRRGRTLLRAMKHVSGASRAADGTVRFTALAQLVQPEYPNRGINPLKRGLNTLAQALRRWPEPGDVAHRGGAVCTDDCGHIDVCAVDHSHRGGRAGHSQRRQGKDAGRHPARASAGVRRSKDDALRECLQNYVGPEPDATTGEAERKAPADRKAHDPAGGAEHDGSSHVDSTKSNKPPSAAEPGKSQPDGERQ